VPTIISLVRFKRISRIYLPFLLFIWAGTINETFSFYADHAYRSNAVNSNIYALLEAIFLTWQFKNWRLFENNKQIFTIIIASYIIFWVIEAIILNQITIRSSYFRVYSAFFIVLFSIYMMNKELMVESGNILRNSVFLCCVGLLIFFSFRFIICFFWAYGLRSVKSLMIPVIYVAPYIDCLSNLIYGLAILWMPKKHRFLLQF
jgi:hypothetical protein